MVIPEGTDFNSLDGKPVKLLFLIAAPKKGTQQRREKVKL